MNIAKNLSLLSVVWQHFITLSSVFITQVQAVLLGLGFLIVELHIMIRTWEGNIYVHSALVFWCRKLPSVQSGQLAPLCACDTE